MAVRDLSGGIGGHLSHYLHLSIARGQPLDFAGITDTVVPSFAQFAKGGNHQRRHNAVSAEGDKTLCRLYGYPPLQRTEDGAPSA